MLANKNLIVLLFSLCIIITAAGLANAAGITIGAGSTLDVATATLTVPGTVSNEGTLRVSTGQIKLTGDWINHGTFECGTSTVEINNPTPTTVPQIVRGNTSFYIFKIDTSGAGSDRYVTFEVSSTQTMYKKLILKGDSGGTGKKLVLKSTTPGVYWNINPITSAGATRDVSRVIVSDSTNVDPVTIEAWYSTNGGNTVRWFFGGSPFETGDLGWIRNTSISREGENLILSWTYDLGKGATTVAISIETTATNDSYVANVANYAPLVQLVSGTLSYKHVGVAHSGANYYYRVVPAGFPGMAPGTDILSSECNGRTAGKTNLPLMYNGYNFVAIPFQVDSVSLEAFLGDQIGTEGEFLWWDGAYHKGAYSGTAWIGEDRLLDLGEGFFVRAKTPNRVLTLYGTIGKFSNPLTKDLAGTPSYNPIGYPYPISQTMEVTGVTTANEDELLKWIPGTQAYDGAKYNSGWIGTTGINVFNIGQAKFYRPASSKTWTIVFP